MAVSPQTRRHKALTRRTQDEIFVPVTMTTDSSLLHSELEEEVVYQQLLLQTMGETQTENPESRRIRPQPGLCVKTLSEPDKRKVFINVCQSAAVPPPPPLSREELVELLQSDDPSGYRVPMSLGEPHAEVDNSSQGCTAYDVVINQEFFQTCQKDPLFQQFIILVSVEGLENKYHLEIRRDWKILKNRKFLGSLSEQNIRTKNRTRIEELTPQQTSSGPQRPQFTLLVEPPDGHPENLIAEIKLPGVCSSLSLLLDVGEDRLVLTTRPEVYHLDIYHEYTINQKNTTAWYYSSTQVLVVHMPVVST